MSEAVGPDTIFYTLKLKRTKTPSEAFEKMRKAIKKKGVTENWSCVISDEAMIIDFGDNKSETFCISFDEKKVCDSFCKVCFPINGELFDDEKKSEFKALLNMIWSARSMFSQMEITDDYGQAEEFMESKKYKLSLRELTDEEHERVRSLYDSGITDHPDMIMSIVCHELEMSDDEKWYDRINVNVSYGSNRLKSQGTCMWGFWDTYVYETSEYKNERVMNSEAYNREFGGLWFSAATFYLAIDELYRYRDYCFLGDNRSFGVKHAQIRRFYRDKVYPMLDGMPDGLEKCLLAYRYFLSVYDFCGFKFVGRESGADHKYIKTH